MIKSDNFMSLLDENLRSAWRQSVKKILEEETSKALLTIENRLKQKTAELALTISKMCDVETNSNRIIITIDKRGL